MSRRRASSLRANWKLSLPAPLAARIDLLLLDPLTSKPKYAERARITTQLWEDYLNRLMNEAYHSSEGTLHIPLPDAPHLRFEIAGHPFTLSELEEATRGVTNA
jgi:hypothetical protein